MLRFIGGLIRPYRRTLVIHLSRHAGRDRDEPRHPLAAQDHPRQRRRPPQALAVARTISSARCSNAARGFTSPSLAAAAFVVIAVIGAIASYIDNYYTESVGQWVAHDLRMRMYHHLQRLSLGYYGTHQTGTILSTLTTDIQTIQGFASSSTLSIIVDLLTIVCMLGLMFWLNWDFTLIAIAVTPFLLLFVSQVQESSQSRDPRSPQRTEPDRRRRPAGPRIHAGRQSLRPGEDRRRLLHDVSQATVGAALKARSVKALLSPVVTITVAICTAIVLWRGAVLILAHSMTVGELTVYLAYLTRSSSPSKTSPPPPTPSPRPPSAPSASARSSTPTPSSLRTPTASSPRPSQGAIEFEHVAFGYDPANPILTDVSLQN